MQPNLKDYKGDMKPWAWSPTTLMEWGDCNFKVFMDKVLHRSSFGRSNALALGNGIHAATETISIDYADGKMPNLPENRSKYTDIAFEFAKTDKSRDPSAFHKWGSTTPEDDAVNVIKLYLDRGQFVKPLLVQPHHKRPPSHKVGGKWVTKKYWTEFYGQMFLPDLHYGGSVQVNVKGDVLTEDYKCLDWKSASKPYVPSELSNPVAGKGLQLSSYGVWTHQNFDGKLTENGWSVLIKPNPSKNIEFDVQNLKFQMTEEIVKAYVRQVSIINKEFIESLRNYIENKTEFKRGGNGCDGICYFCAHKPYCR